MSSQFYHFHIYQISIHRKIKARSHYYTKATFHAYLYSFIKECQIIGECIGIRGRGLRGLLGQIIGNRTGESCLGS